MEKKIQMLEINGEEFEVRYKNDGWISGGVYPMCQWFKDKKTGYDYYAKESCDTVEEFNEEKVRCLFEFNFCWRGVWEGRLYFKDDEYWSEELKLMSDVWDKIEQMLKEDIKSKQPEYEYDK